MLDFNLNPFFQQLRNSKHDWIESGEEEGSAAMDTSPPVVKTECPGCPQQGEDQSDFFMPKIDKIAFSIQGSYLTLHRNLRIFLQSCVKGEAASPGPVECLNPAVGDPCKAGVCGKEGTWLNCRHSMRDLTKC